MSLNTDQIRINERTSAFRDLLKSTVRPAFLGLIDQFAIDPARIPDRIAPLRQRPCAGEPCKRANQVRQLPPPSALQPGGPLAVARGCKRGSALLPLQSSHPRQCRVLLAPAGEEEGVLFACRTRRPGP